MTSRKSRDRSSALTSTPARSARGARHPDRLDEPLRLRPRRLSALAQSARCTDTPRPRVTKPTMSSPGAGVQRQDRRTDAQGPDVHTTTDRDHIDEISIMAYDERLFAVRALGGPPGDPAEPGIVPMRCSPTRPTPIEIRVRAGRDPSVNTLLSVSAAAADLRIGTLHGSSRPPRSCRLDARS